ncbi:uncharacterized protein LOC143715556 [Siphateles boraxobius]|uniref:uncharacterized protein LOC143715556 n=1 Tax=Siphateles boraxobius TaxID=180520 RepID=UPI0040630041
MVAVSVDGNRKLHRFQKANQIEEPGFCDGMFLSQDSEVSSFVEEVQGAVTSVSFQGQIFAYPKFLQKEFQGAAFLAMDVTCRYVPYLEKVSEALTHLQPLQKMRHCLSVMDAKAHNTKCELVTLGYASILITLLSTLFNKSTASCRFCGMQGTRKVSGPILVKK